MSRSLNKVQIIGNLGTDPEMRYTQDGRAVANFSVATSDSWNDKQGQRQERTEWHRVTMFGKIAEIAQQYLRKGNKVYLEGQLQTDKYVDKQGIERYSTKIMLLPYNGQMIMLTPRDGGAGGGYGGAPAGGGYGGAPAGGGYGGAPAGGGYGGAPAAPAYTPPPPQVPQYAGPQDAGPQYAGPQNAPPPPPAAKPAVTQEKPAAKPADNFDQTPEFDDDIPF